MTGVAIAVSARSEHCWVVGCLLELGQSQSNSQSAVVVVVLSSGSTHRTRQGSVRHCRALIPKMFRVDDDDFSSYELGCRNAVGNVE